MLKQKIFLAGVVAGLCLAGPVNAEIITFDDVTVDNNQAIVSPYDGLNWNNVNIMPDNVEGDETGYNNGVVSAPNTAYDASGSGRAACSAVSGNVALNSAYFTGAWGAQNVTVDGFVNGVEVDSVTFAVLETAPTLETFNWSGLTSVSWKGSGPANGYAAQVVVDNISLTLSASAVPEMSSWAMLLAGFAALGFAGYRRKNAGVIAGSRVI